MPGAGYRQLFIRKADGSGKAEQVTATADDSTMAVWAPILTTCTVPKLEHKTLAQAKKLLRKAACTLGKIRGSEVAPEQAARHVAERQAEPGAARRHEGGRAHQVARRRAQPARISRLGSTPVNRPATASRSAGTSP